MSLNGIVLNWFYEWAAKGKSYADLRQKLQKNEATVYARMSNATELFVNRHQSAHVIGIERWSAHRMRVLLGDSLVIDEYDGYAPSEQLSMAELAEEFRQTREATLALLQELQDKGIDLSRTVIHNEVGDLSAGGWFVYMENHTGRETVLLIQHLHHKPKHAPQP